MRIKLKREQLSGDHVLVSDIVPLIERREKQAGQRAVARYRREQRERARNKTRRASRKGNR